MTDLARGGKMRGRRGKGQRQMSWGEDGRNPLLHSACEWIHIISATFTIFEKLLRVHKLSSKDANWFATYYVSYSNFVIFAGVSEYFKLQCNQMSHYLH